MQLCYLIIYVIYTWLTTKVENPNKVFGMYLFGLIVFIIHFIVYFEQGRSEAVLFRQQQLYRNWIRINCILMLFELPFLRIQRMIHKRLHLVSLLAAISMA